MKSCLTPLPSRFANPIVPGIAALLLQKTWADALAAPAPASATTDSAHADTPVANRRPRLRPTSWRAVNLIGTSLCGGVSRHRDRAVRGADRNPDIPDSNVSFLSLPLPIRLARSLRLRGRETTLLGRVRASLADAGPRRALLIVAALLAVVAAAALVLLLKGDGEGRPSPPPATPVGVEPLAFMPAGASAVLDFDTRQPAAGFAAVGLIPKLPGATLSAEQVQRLTGGRIAVALADGRLWIAAQSRSAPPRPSGGAVAAKQGGTVVVAPDTPALRASLDGAAAAAGDARAMFDRRFVGLPASSARVAFDPRAALADRSPAVAGTAWGRSLREGAAVLVVSGDRVVLPFTVSADPAGLSPADLPIATGAGAPRAAGRGPVVAAVRYPRRRCRSCAPPACSRPSTCSAARPASSAGPANLGPEATIVASDQQNLTVRTTPPDPGDWLAKLRRLDALSGLIRLPGSPTCGSTANPAAPTRSRATASSRPVGVYGPVVVFSTDPVADLNAAARAPAAAPVTGAAGALTVRLAPSLFGALLPALARGHVADVTGWAAPSSPRFAASCRCRCADRRFTCRRLASAWCSTTSASPSRTWPRPSGSTAPSSPCWGPSPATRTPSSSSGRTGTSSPRTASTP